MADPVNPFTPADLAKYKEFFKQPARPNVFGTPAGQQALETERAGLASFLGATDYGQQLEQSQDMGKLQLALALAQRGFAAAGATPKRGESSISTLSRELFSPLAGDAGAVASRMMQQRQALKAAERQEERQLKLAALQNVQGRQEKAFADDAAATQQARNFMQSILKKDDTVSNDYLVGGKNIPLIKRKDHTGQIQGFFRLDGTKVNSAGVTIKPDATAAVKPITSWAKDVQVKGEDGKFRDAPGALKIADGTGKNSRVVLDNVTLDFDPKSKNYNARIVKKKSDQSAFYNPKSKSVFLSKTAIELYGLPKDLVGQKATYREYLVKPERRAANSQSIKELSVGGKTYVFNSHSGYDPMTGNITVERGPDEPPVTYEATQLFREEDPKAYVDVGDPLTVPSGSRLAEIRKIKGLSRITANETLRFQKNAAGEERILYGNQTITLSPDESALFQVRGLSDVEKLDAGQTFRKFIKKGELIVPPGKANLIPGSVVGETVTVEEDQEGKVRYTYKGEVVSKDLALQLQASPLSDVDKVSAGLVVEPRNTYVNTSDRSLTVGGQAIGPGQTGYFSKTDLDSAAFKNVSTSFRETGPVSTDLKTFMFKESKTIDGVNYVPGDEIRRSPQAFENLPDDVRKSLTDDTALRAQTVKKNYFTALWADVTKREGLRKRTITELDLQSLLGMFPAGMRSGGKNLREEIFAMLKYGENANQGSGPTTASAAASAQAQTYAESVQQNLSEAGKRYEIFREKDALGNVPWETLSYERKRAFADLPKSVQLGKIKGAWQGSEDRLAKDKAAIKSASPEDVAAFSSAVELLILAKRLRDGQELDKTGRFFVGTLGSLGANIFADVSPLTSGGSRRLQQIINRMKASYATLSEVEPGRDSVFKQQLQAELIPSFTKAENLNRDNLKSIINRLETNIRSTFNQEVISSTVVPKTFEIMAKDAGITGVSVDQRRYRWLDPNVQETPPVTRQRVMEGINMITATFEDAKDLRVGRILPLVAPNAPNMRYVKLKNLDNGEVVIQEARPDGRPKAGSPKLILGTDMKTRLQ